MEEKERKPDFAGIKASPYEDGFNTARKAMLNKARELLANTNK